MEEIKYVLHDTETNRAIGEFIFDQPGSLRQLEVREHENYGDHLFAKIMHMERAEKASGKLDGFILIDQRIRKETSWLNPKENEIIIRRVYGMDRCFTFTPFSARPKHGLRAVDSK